MVGIQSKTLIEIMYELIGIDPNPELDVIMILLTTIVILFIFDSVLRAFIQVLFGTFKNS